MACKCGRTNCKGHYLLHPAEMKEVPALKAKELEKDENCTFDLCESPSSGELFTKFHELHVLSALEVCDGKA